MFGYLGCGCGQDVHEFLSDDVESLLEFDDIAAVFLVDHPGHGVEVVPQGLEAQGVPVLEQLIFEGVGLEVGDDLVGLLLNKLVYFLQGGDVWMGAGVRLLVMVSTRCCMKARL